MTRYQFLAAQHEMFAPVEVYLETGVQTGASLALAEKAGMAIGLDPVPGVHAHHKRDNQRVYGQTADQYFNCESCERHPIDFGFIDGSHLFEDALRDFVYMERHSRPGTVIVFDDVLPYNQDIAWRHQPPGDWTGDVFKIPAILAEYREDLEWWLVDVQPTGALVVTGLDAANVVLDRQYDKIERDWKSRHYVPDDVLARTHAVAPDRLLATLPDVLASMKTKGIRR